MIFRIDRADQRLIFFEEDLLDLGVLLRRDQPRRTHTTHHAHRGMVHFLAMKCFLHHGQSPPTAKESSISCGCCRKSRRFCRNDGTPMDRQLFAARDADGCSTTCRCFRSNHADKMQTKQHKKKPHPLQHKE